jgi:hypothetical protein
MDDLVIKMGGEVGLDAGDEVDRKGGGTGLGSKGEKRLRSSIWLDGLGGLRLPLVESALVQDEDEGFRECSPALLYASREGLGADEYGESEVGLIVEEMEPQILRDRGEAGGDIGGAGNEGGGVTEIGREILIEEGFCGLD